MNDYKPGRPSKQAPPKEPGEYRYRDKETGEIVYIGETNDLDRRIKEHERTDISSENNEAEWKQAEKNSTTESRREHEKEKIKQHDPSLNQRAGGGGRKSKK